MGLAVVLSLARRNTRPPQVADLLVQAESALMDDDLNAARVAYQQVLRIDPDNVIARQGVSEVDREIAALCRRCGIRPERHIRLAVPAAEVLDGTVPNEAAVLSQLLTADDLAIEELLDRCALPETAVLEILSRFVDRAVVAVV
jgi:hypothetical protein